MRFIMSAGPECRPTSTVVLRCKVLHGRSADRSLHVTQRMCRADKDARVNAVLRRYDSGQLGFYVCRVTRRRTSKRGCVLCLEQHVIAEVVGKLQLACIIGLSVLLLAGRVFTQFGRFLRSRGRARRAAISHACSG